MRLPWQHGAQAGDELEALQTDVMRFIAILGLCLVAIFSLVNGAQQERVIEQPEQMTGQPGQVTEPQVQVIEPQEQVTEPQVQVAEPQVEVAEQQQPAPTPEVKLVSAPPVNLQPAPSPQPPVTPESPPPTPDEPGFTLEFESSDALRSLLATGHIQLFAMVDGGFNRYHPDGAFRQVNAPQSYYQMDPATVPPRLRLRAESLYSGSINWGVILPASTVSDIQRLMSAGAGGTLLIGAEASVRLVND